MLINVKAIKTMVKASDKQIGKEAIIQIDKKVTELMNKIIAEATTKRIKEIL